MKIAARQMPVLVLLYAGFRMFRWLMSARLSRNAAITKQQYVFTHCRRLVEDEHCVPSAWLAAYLNCVSVLRSVTGYQFSIAFDRSRTRLGWSLATFVNSQGSCFRLNNWGRFSSLGWVLL